MDVKKRIEKLMDSRGWSRYRLAAASGLSQSTVENVFSRNTTPSISTLESICDAFGITLSQFFDEDSDLPAMQNKNEMMKLFALLTDGQREAVFNLIKSMNVYEK